MSLPRLPRRHAVAALLGPVLAALAGCGAARRAQSAADVLRAEAAARRAVAEERALDPAAYPPRTVGVVPLEAPPGDTVATALAYAVADLLTTDLAQSAQLRVVERVRTDAVLRELRLAESGRVDAATAPRVGRLVGARRLVLGAVTSGAGRFRLDVRVADAAGAGVRAGGTADAPLDAIFEAETALALRLFEALGVTLTPAERARVEQRPTRNVGALLAYGRGVRAEAVGDFRAARDHYRRASTLDPAFGRARERAERAGAVAAVREPGAAPSAVARVAGLANAGVNRPLATTAALPPRATDAAFPLLQLVTLVLTVTAP